MNLIDKVQWSDDEEIVLLSPSDLLSKPAISTSCSPLILTTYFPSKTMAILYTRSIPSLVKVTFSNAVTYAEKNYIRIYMCLSLDI